ncbi:demethylmenaquinone methyltransferase [Paenibacillus antri]|uniref:Demethylmenaquinone methyltransferase n=1 Tax=Paenibacillus antri TaxID=2582848 RepID=A0A5R9G9I1_9BACL|nr:demethylmenaquinone methyltransferase [Paenibacillus antri]TLS53092.1 demethylmenaquinone methyltransferase [Paenibacillus antri]
MSVRNKEKHVHSVFETIAPNYDLMNDVISFRRHKAWREYTMRRMDVKPGQSAIDLCCGTCDWTIALAKASGTGEIVGLDFSRNMLEIGRAKVEKEGLDGTIELVQGNAMALPFEDDRFDFATIGFGLRNVPDLDVVLKEMARVVKPGGKVVCLETSKPTAEPFRTVYYLYFEHILPRLAKWFVKRYEQYKWLPESLAAFPGREELEERFRQAGLADVKSRAFFMGVAALHIGTKV